MLLWCWEFIEVKNYTNDLKITQQTLCSLIVKCCWAEKKPVRSNERLMVFNATFNNICYIVVISFIGGGNRSTRLKTTDLSQVTDKFDHIMLYTSPWSSFELTTPVVIGADCIGSCISNYHTITTMITPTQYWSVKLFSRTAKTVNKYSTVNGLSFKLV